MTPLRSALGAADDSFARTELDAAAYPEWRDRIRRFPPDPEASRPRSYPGYPTWRLERVRRRWFSGLDGILSNRRSVPALGTTLPTHVELSRILLFAHGVLGPDGRGPVPSAGGLQSLELYLVVPDPGRLPAGAYHYDRAGHHLSQIVDHADRADWRQRVPSLELLTGGALLWVVVGDGRRVRAKYGERGMRFLLLEAGHLMQNLCLLSASLGLCTVPLGGFFERPIARELRLPDGDEVPYVGVCGKPAPEP